jgi:hypothetical protein
MLRFGPKIREEHKGIYKGRWKKRRKRKIRQKPI